MIGSSSHKTSSRRRFGQGDTLGTGACARAWFAVNRTWAPSIPAGKRTDCHTLHEYPPLDAAHVFLLAKAAGGIRLRFMLKFVSTGLGLATFSPRSDTFPTTISRDRNRLQNHSGHAALGRPFNPAQGLRALAHGQAHGGSGKDDRSHGSERGNRSTAHPVGVGDLASFLLPDFR
jgi:hypothetical protein